MSAADKTGLGYSFMSLRAQMIDARPTYIKRHGARFLFDNKPPPAPGWPRIVKGRLIRSGAA